MPDIVVFGSLNADLVLGVSALPGPGQTVLGGAIERHSGGKGANQAVAAARYAVEVTGSRQSASRVRMVGRVGADEHGARLREDLIAAGVDVTAVVVDPRHDSGIALILVDPAGENLIAVSPGANAAVDGEDVARVRRELRPDDVVLCQLEVPLPAVRQLAGAARAAGARLVCNAAPATPLPADLLAQLDVLVVNEAEARTVFGDPVRTPSAARAAAARAGCAVVVTLGAAGAVYAADPTNAADLVGHCPATGVTVVDTVGAGDAFVGALAASLAAGRPLPEAVAAGVAAGTHAVTHRGARWPGPPADPPDSPAGRPARPEGSD